jgi:hypothetical protein
MKETYLYQSFDTDHNQSETILIQGNVENVST